MNIRPTKINYTNFIKLRDKISHNIEAAKCKDCKKILVTVTDKRLDAHRRSCKGRDRPIGPNENGAASDEIYDEEDFDIADKKQILDSDLAKFFYSGGVPFVKVENHFLSRFCHNLGRFNIEYKLPDRRTLASSLLQKVHKEIISLKKKLLQGTEGVLLVDGWKNKVANRKYLVFSVKNVNTDLCYLIHYDTSLETEDGETLKEHIKAAIEYAKKIFECYIYAILSDNDAKIVKGGDLATTSDNKKLLQATCSSHSGNLLLKDFVDQELVNLSRDVVTAFRDPKLEALLICAKGTRLQNFPDTRFCFFRDTCKSISDNLTQLRKLSNVSDVPLSVIAKQRIQSKDFEDLLKTIIVNLDPICQLINKCQDPSVNIADATEMWVTLKLPDNDYNFEIARRLNRALRPINFAANLMHHKYNGESLNENQRETAETFLSTYLSDNAQSELRIYNSTKEDYDRLARHCNDPVDYWKIVEVSLPTLSKECIRLQLIPASTASLEGMFSQWTYVHSLYRNRLGNEKSADLLDIYHSFKSKYFYGEEIDELKKLHADGEETRW